MLRRLIAIFAAVIVSLLFFKAMHAMTNQQGNNVIASSDNPVIDFVRTKRDTDTQKKRRQKKQPPKPKKPAIPKSSATQTSTTTVSVTPFAVPLVEASFSISNNSLMGDAKVGFGGGDNDAIPLVKSRVIYPPKAKSRNITGFVKARLKLNADGTVDDVEIIESKPRGVFERASIRALYGYKFQPKLVDGKPTKQVVTQTLTFNLEGVK